MGRIPYGFDNGFDPRPLGFGAVFSAFGTIVLGSFEQEALFQAESFDWGFPHAILTQLFYHGYPWQ